MASKLLHREPCPRCREQGLDNSGDNLAVYDDGHSYCYRAGCGYFSNGKEEFNTLDDTFTYEYIPHRGITQETYRFYDTKTKIDKDGKPVSVGFKYPNEAHKVRLLAQKEFYSVGDMSRAGLFGRDKFSAGSSDSVTITEGEYDAQSLYQLIRKPVVSVQSSSSCVRDCTVDLDWLRSFNRVYVAFDSDVSGREALRKVAPLFDYNRLYVVRLTKHKDANAYLQAGDGDELLTAWHNAKKYLPDEIRSSFAEFREILKDPPQWGVPYPFPTLTHMTYGIRKGESVLITAQEKVGKTELMHAIEHQLLRETNDPIGAIYLEEPPKRHLQALAGIELGKPVHLPDTPVSSDEVVSAVENLIKTDDRLHIHTHFGSDDPNTLLDTIRFLVVSRQCSYILLDHISMVVSGLAGEDERRALDYFSTRLEMMVKELNFALILVSHVNDEGKTRGSRYISKVCDIRIDASRDMVSPDPVVRNTMELTVSLNRYCGRTGPAGTLIYDQNRGTFTEREAANDNLKDQGTFGLVA